MNILNSEQFLIMALAAACFIGLVIYLVRKHKSRAGKMTVDNGLHREEYIIVHNRSGDSVAHLPADEYRKMSRAVNWSFSLHFKQCMNTAKVFAKLIGQGIKTLPWIMAMLIVYVLAFVDPVLHESITVVVLAKYCLSLLPIIFTAVFMKAFFTGNFPGHWNYFNEAIAAALNEKIPGGFEVSDETVFVLKRKT